MRIRDLALTVRTPPDECIVELGQVAREAGTGRLRCIFNALGGLDRATTLTQMELFAAEVLPACRAIEPPRPVAVAQAEDHLPGSAGFQPATGAARACPERSEGMAALPGEPDLGGSGHNDRRRGAGGLDA